MEWIKREDALAFPFANGQYDTKNADEHFIRGCESYKEYLEGLPSISLVCPLDHGNDDVFFKKT